MVETSQAEIAKVPKTTVSGMLLLMSSAHNYVMHVLVKPHISLYKSLRPQLVCGLSDLYQVTMASTCIWLILVCMFMHNRY